MSLALSAGAATWSQILRVAVTLATYAVLRRFIPPEEMGVWTWAEALFLILGQVRDLGIPAEISRQHTPRYGNYLLVLLGWGAALAMAILVAAPMIARAYEGDPQTTIDVLRFLCLFLLIQGLGVLPQTFLDVQLLTVRTVPAELVRNAAFAIASIFLASHGFGVWSVIYAHTGAAILYTIGVWIAAQGLLKLDVDRPQISPLILASLPLMLLSMLELAVLSVDVFILGKRFSPEVVGHAGLATLAAYFVGRQLADATGRPLYPAMLRAGEPKDSYSVYSAATLLFAGVLAPAAISLFLNADAIVEVLGGPEWTGAAEYIRWFAFVPLVRPLSLFGRELLLILRRDRLLLVYSALSLGSITLIGIVLTGTRLGPFGMAVAGFFALGQIVLFLGIRAIPETDVSDLLLGIARLYLVNLLAFTPLLLWGDELHPYLRLAASAVLSATLVLLTVWHYGDERRLLLGVQRPTSP